MFRLNIKTIPIYNPNKIIYGGVGLGGGLSGSAERGQYAGDSVNSVKTETTEYTPSPPISAPIPTIAHRLREFSYSSPSSPTTSMSSLLGISNSCLTLHPTHIEFYKRLPTTLSALNHLLLFGARGVGKEYQARTIIANYSASRLVAERKIMIAPDTKNEFWTNSSDIHYEIDFQHLGCRAVSAWHDFFEHVREITLSKHDKTSIILIKNFHHIPTELLSVFHSYIHMCDKNCCIRIIGTTEAISHMPDDLIDIFEVIEYSRPTKKEYISVVSGIGESGHPAIPSTTTNSVKNSVGRGTTECPTEIPEVSSIRNLRRIRATLKSKCPEKMGRNYFSVVEDRITESLIGSILADRPNIHLIREQLYQIPIQLVEVENILWLLLSRLLERGILHEEQLSLVWRWYYDYAHHHNHHYRYIYHVEQFIFRIIHMVKHGSS